MYGWFVVAAGFAMTFVGFGGVYSFSAFFVSLQRDFGASRGSVSFVFSLAAFIYFGLGSVSGPLADRFGSRRLALAGMILVALGLAAASAAQSLVQIYAAYALGVGVGVGLSYVPAMGAVQRWFAKRRALASGLASTGIGAGTLVAPPVALISARSMIHLAVPSTRSNSRQPRRRPAAYSRCTITSCASGSTVSSIELGEGLLPRSLLQKKWRLAPGGEPAAREPGRGTGRGDVTGDA